MTMKFRGGALNLAGRLCALASAGQTLASEAVVHLAGHLQGVTFRERTPVQLKGMDRPVRPIEVLSSADETGIDQPRDVESPIAVVTVMFTNIIESAELASRLRDEEW
jgi:class 3 adenylate cyclase